MQEAQILGSRGQECKAMAEKSCFFPTSLPAQTTGTHRKKTMKLSSIGSALTNQKKTTKKKTKQRKQRKRKQRKRKQIKRKQIKRKQIKRKQIKRKQRKRKQIRRNK